MKRITPTRPAWLLAVGLLLVTSLLAGAQPNAPLVTAVDAIDMTVSDMDREIAFYAGVLNFQKVSDTEVAGQAYEDLEGVFGVRTRLVRMRLGDEFILLTEYLAPKGKPIPPGARSNDRSF